MFFHTSKSVPLSRLVNAKQTSHLWHCCVQEAGIDLLQRGLVSIFSRDDEVTRGQVAHRCTNAHRHTRSGAVILVPLST